MQYVLLIHLKFSNKTDTILNEVERITNINLPPDALESSERRHWIIVNPFGGFCGIFLDLQGLFIMYKIFYIII